MKQVAQTPTDGAGDAPHVRGRSFGIAVISPTDPRRARTNAVCDVRLCSSLASLGHRVEWVVPSMGPRDRLQGLDIWDVHGVEPGFDIRFVRTSSADGPRDLGRILPLAVHGLRTVFRGSRPDFVISRDLRLVAASLLLRRGSIAVPWLHEYRAESWEKMLCRRASVLLATNSAIVEDLRADGVSGRSFLTSNPIPEQWAAKGGEADKRRARREIGLDDSQPLVVYTGKLYAGMTEFDYLLLAARALPDVHFILTGGRPEVIGKLRAEVTRRGLSNVLLTGFLDHPASAQQYQIAADILVSYYSVTDHPHARHNLPNKLAEYMATGNPVVVADFPAVRDLANPSTAILVPPDTPSALVKAIRDVADHPSRAHELATNARRLVDERSSERVARELVDFLAEATSP